jgi:hypothetical protein
MKKNFKDWALDEIEEVFHLNQVDVLEELEQLLTFEYSINNYEQKYLDELKAVYLIGGDDWNEVELENKFISPLFVFAKIDNKQFAYFLERELSTNIGEYQIMGKVDGMIATGFRKPRKPYFCLNEYKRQTDPDGDPRAQVLIAMLAAQHINDDNNPIYGCYIIGRSWYFMALQGQNYAISNVFTGTDEELYDIFRVLKSLRFHIQHLSQTG